MKMNKITSHRGPDRTSFWLDDGVSLGHNRLSIIDLSEGANQPMEDGAGDCIIVFNGEIYNFKELKKELSSVYEFKTKSDTEVILAGYKVWGKEVVNHLNGIFAFTIWDKKDRSFFSARDHMGVKPFYYVWQNQKFIFSSEIKGLLEYPINRILNKKAFNAYMRVLYVPEPETIIDGIHKLPPGSWLYLKNGKIEIKTYWKPEIQEKKWNYADAKNETLAVVEKAAQRQLLADVPVGVYLSGGIDSSAVLASVSRVKKNVKTFSIGFDIEEEEGKEKFNRDFELAKETAKYFGADHHPLTIGISDVANTLEETIGSLNDIISNPTALPMMHLSRFAKKEVIVVLSGDGGDELFGGYERYRLSVISDMVRAIPGVRFIGNYSQKVKKLLTSPGVDRLELFEFEKDTKLSRVLNKKYMQSAETLKTQFKKYDEGAKDGTDRLMITDIRSWLPDQALGLGDAMSMANAVEDRVPLLDREVVDFALSLPRGFKVNPFGTKIILKDAFRKELPEILFRQPKRGWFSPGAKWMRRREVSDIFREVLSKDYYPPTSGLFDWDNVEKMLNDHIEKREYNLTILWAILTFQIWMRKYKVIL